MNRIKAIALLFFFPPFPHSVSGWAWNRPSAMYNHLISSSNSFAVATIYGTGSISAKISCLFLLSLVCLYSHCVLVLHFILLSDSFCFLLLLSSVNVLSYNAFSKCCISRACVFVWIDCHAFKCAHLWCVRKKPRTSFPWHSLALLCPNFHFLITAKLKRNCPFAPHPTFLCSRSCLWTWNCLKMWYRRMFFF